MISVVGRDVSGTLQGFVRFESGRAQTAELPAGSIDSPVGQGRDPDVAVVLDSPSVSRHHARISIGDGQATFEDLGSKNGSTVDGRPANGPIDLADGDVITVGAVDMKFQSFRPLGSTETVIKR